jgi:small-conductance mechanosensitive channel
MRAPKHLRKASRPDVMWTIVFLGFAALLWLMELALSPQGMASDSALHGLDRVALGFASLAGAQLLMSLLYQLIRRGGPAGRTIRSDLLRTLLAAVVYLSVFFLYVHLGLGFDITALLATSAVLSLVVGLALQATLGNLFAGVSIELEHRVQIGDYVRRGTLAGQVLSLGWRSIHMRGDAGSILVVPNSSVTSDVLEVVPEGQPYRHEIDFTVSEQHAPGLVMQMATRVLRSGMPGLCETGLGDVIYRGIQPESGAYRYTARFYISAVSQRNAIGSSVLERVWYELARLDQRELAYERTGEAIKFDETPWRPILRSALANESPDLEAQLLKSAQIRRYARQERYAEREISLIVEGSLSESRSPAGAVMELKEILAEITKVRGNETHRGRLDYDSYHNLKTLGINYVGPMADRLCRRIADATDDPWVAYQVFAAFIRDSGQREEFLTHAPRESLRLMRQGTWLGLAPHPTGHDVLHIYRAHENCTLLLWSAAEFRASFDASPDRAASPLAALLGHREQGGARGTGSNLRA